MPQAQAARVDFAFPDGSKYSYPNGPFKTNLFVLFYKNGSGFNVHHGDARAVQSTDRSHLGPHTVSVYDASGTKLEDVGVPAHWWNSEWNWPLSYPKIVNTPADMMAKRYSFVYGPGGFKLGGQPKHVPYTKPMDMSDITLYQPTTGERNDIGDDTEDTAAWLLGGSADMMLAWAKSAASCPMHFRDGKTGFPVNLLNEIWNAYDLPGYMAGTYIWKGPPADPKVTDGGGYSQMGGNIVVQQAHNPDLCSEAALAAMDIGFLRSLQYNATFMVCCDGTLAGKAIGKPIVSGEMRGIAWAFRNIAAAWKCTLEFEKAGFVMADYYLHDSAYWKKVLDANRDYYKTFMTDPNNQVFHTIPTVGRFGPWQMDYMCDTLYYMCYIGLDDWFDLAMFAAKNQTDRVGGSDYPLGFGGAYYLNTMRGGGNAWNPANGPVPSNWGVQFKNWRETMDDQHVYGGQEGSPDNMTDAEYAALWANPTRGFVPYTGREYCMNLHAGIAALVQLDAHPLYAGKVKAKFPDLSTYFSNIDKLLKANGTSSTINLRAALIASTTYVPYDFGAPPVVTDPGPITNPPTPLPTTPTPIPAPSYPVPELDPLSYTFEAKALVTAVTALNNVYIDCAGKQPTTSGQLALNVKGNKYTNLFINYPGAYADWFHQYPDTPQGAKVWIENHASGSAFHLVDCGGVNINGVQLTPLVTPPVVVPPPVVTVKALTSVSLAQTASVKVGETVNLSASYLPLDAEGISVSVSTGDVQSVSAIAGNPANGTINLALKGLVAGNGLVTLNVTGKDAEGRAKTITRQVVVSVVAAPVEPVPTTIALPRKAWSSLTASDRDAVATGKKRGLMATVSGKDKVLILPTKDMPAGYK